MQHSVPVPYQGASGTSGRRDAPCSFSRGAEARALSMLGTAAGSKAIKSSLSARMRADCTRVHSIVLYGAYAVWCRMLHTAVQYPHHLM